MTILSNCNFVVNQSRINRLKELFPGTDDDTGWVQVPMVFCCKPLLASPERCHMALEPMTDCVYEPSKCPFYGHYPDQAQTQGKLM